MKRSTSLVLAFLLFLLPTGAYAAEDEQKKSYATNIFPKIP
jgi:hypothetical protein